MPIAAEHDACGIGFVADATGRSSRAIVAAALEGLACVKHRGALAADARSGDGSGLLVPIPPEIFGRDADGTPHGLAMLFVRGDDPTEAVEAAAAAEGIRVVEWRDVPTDDGELGELALSTRPRIVQAVLAGAGHGSAANEKAAFRLRRRIDATTDGTYVASCSFRTVCYKGLVTADALGDFYLDLADERFAASFAIFHQRFSTNTLPTWERAQPFRMLCHNGEINALAGNVNRMRARAVLGTEAAGLGPEELFHPVLDPDDSDSGQLDSAIELLTRGGRDVRHAVAMTIPEAWEGERDLDPAVRAFYRYHASLMEPWDGPAGLVFTDGRRRGRRPRPQRPASPALLGVRGRVRGLLLGDGRHRRVRPRPGHPRPPRPGRDALRRPHPGPARRRPPASSGWRRAAPTPGGRPTACADMSRGRAIEQTPEPDEIERRQAIFGYSKEELAMVLRRMANDAKEPTYSMGDDSPLPHLAGRPRPLHHYLKQRFAQVTNPPIDHLRERLVMSLRTCLGPRQPHPVRGAGGHPAAGAQVVLPVPVGRRRPARVRPRLRGGPPRRHLPRGRRPGRAAGRGRAAVRPGRGAGPGRHRHPHHRRRRGRRRAGGGARPAGHRARSTPGWWRAGCGPTPAWWSRPTTPATPTTSPA